eukprot:80292-Chlamydomonas_euryale.AAC.1
MQGALTRVKDEPAKAAAPHNPFGCRGGGSGSSTCTLSRRIAHRAWQHLGDARIGHDLRPPR